MKICDLLVEAPKDELALQQTARALTDYIIRAVESGEVQEYNGVHHLSFKLMDVLPKGSASHLSTAFRHTEIFAKLVGPRSDSDNGTYHVGMNSITLNVRSRLNPETGNQEVIEPGQLFSTATHELRHRLDDARGGRKAFSYKETYEKQAHEINARFTQAVAALTTQLRASYDAGTPMTANEFVRAFEEQAVKFNLMKVFDTAPGGVTDLFLGFFENGIFGVKSGFDATRSIASAMQSTEIQHIGPVNDRRYRRLISRLVLIYQAALARWSKERKKK